VAPWAFTLGPSRARGVSTVRARVHTERIEYEALGVAMVGYLAVQQNTGNDLRSGRDG
jgi:hypothetical protein